MPILGTIASSKLIAVVAGDYESIASTTLGSSSSTITFSGIPSTYAHLQLRILATPGTTGDGRLYVNGNNGTYTHQFYGIGAGTPNSGASASQAYYDAGGVSTSFPATYLMDILDYANTNKTKVVRCFWGYDYNGSGRLGVDSMLYNTTSAITQLSIVDRTYQANSVFALYGIKGA